MPSRTFRFITIIIAFSITGLTFAIAAEADAPAKAPAKGNSADWVSLFDGKTLSGWKASENATSCRVENGAIVVHGPRSHLYYVGDVNQGQFRNFEFKCEVMTKPKANSGVYFHTRYQKQGWPNRGYEAQVNNTGSDATKTGSLYGVTRVGKAPATDDQWFEYHIIVRGKRIILKIDGNTVADYTEPDDLKRPKRQLSSGTFAFQAHDPGSKVLYRNVRVKVLP